MRQPLWILVVLQTGLILWFSWLLWVAPPEPASAGERGRVDPTKAPVDPLRAEVPIQGDERSRDDQMRREVAERTAPEGTAAGDGVLLYGRILDPLGQPVPNAGISVRHSPSRYLRAQVDDRGNYALAGVIPGEWRFYVGASGYRRQDQDLPVEQTPREQRMDFTLEPAVALQIIAFTPDGKPLLDALREFAGWHRITIGAVATQGPPGSFAPTDNSMLRLGLGRFSPSRWSREPNDDVPGLVGRMELQGDPPVYVSLVLRHVILASQPVIAGQDEVEFEIPIEEVTGSLGSVTVQVLDGETGRPFPGARVAVTDAQSGSSGTPVGDDGTVTIENIPPGIMDLEVNGKDRAGVHRHIRIGPGERLDAGTVVLQPAQNVSGLVYGPDGKPVQAHMSWDDLEQHTPPMPLINNRSARSNAEGEFVLWNVRASRFALHARADDLVAHVLVDATNGPPEDLVIRMQPGVPVEVVKDIAPDKHYLVSVRSRAGLPVYGNLVRGGGDMTLHLPPGEYLADVHEDLTLVRSFGFTVGSAKTQIRIP